MVPFPRRSGSPQLREAAEATQWMRSPRASVLDVQNLEEPACEGAAGKADALLSLQSQLNAVSKGPRKEKPASTEGQS